MKIGERRCLVCDCEGTMRLDGEALAAALGSGAPPVVHHQLCRAEIERFEAAAASGPVLVACTQEAPLFTVTAGEGMAGEQDEGEGTGGNAAVDLAFLNIRERAGWSDEGAAALPKIAALLAEAGVPAAPPPALTLTSEGRCLIYGAGQVALDAALRLKDRLTVTLLLSAADDVLPPRRVDFPILAGRIRLARGHLGAFQLTADGCGPMAPSSRDRLRFAGARNGVELEADLILDLSGGTALFPAPEKRDGYLRADPNDSLAVERLLLSATDLVGEFDKPIYVDFKAELCAHSRSRRTGCTRCLEQCPTGAITPNGNHVRIDPHICAGCGACAGVCPTGAATYAHPQPSTLLDRMRVLLGTYGDAGGRDAVLFVYEERHGEDIVAVMARLGRGLPARVLPFALGEIAQLPLEALAAAFAYGGSALVLLVPPAKLHECTGLEANLGYLGAVLDGLGFGADRLRLVVEDDPDLVEAALWDLPRHAPIEAGAFLPVGGKRSRLRLAFDRLHEVAPTPVERVPLPAGAPFGRIDVDVEGCTLCLACVGACPTGALLDSSDQPMLRFVEDACVQCGLCANTCPERVIRLEPRLDFTAAAKSPQTIKAEEPAHCIRCGKAFGSKSSIERIVGKLAGAHSMFQSPERIALIRMCDDCRVRAQFETTDNPFRYDERPRVRTSDDYLREREEAERGQLVTAAKNGG